MNLELTTSERTVMEGRFPHVAVNPFMTYKFHLVTLYNLYRMHMPNVELCPPETFLGHKDVVVLLMGIIEGNERWKESTQRVYMNALKLLAQSAWEWKLDPELVKRMDFFIKQKKRELDWREKENKLDGKEVDRWRSWDDIWVIWYDLNQYCETNHGWDSDLYAKLQQRLALAMYLFHPPLRLDYGRVFLPPFSDGWIHMDEKKYENFMYFEKGELYFHLGHDKVTAKMGTIELAVTSYIAYLLLDLIQRMALHTPVSRQYLLTSGFDLSQPLCPADERLKRGLYSLLYSIPDREGKVSKLTVDTLRSAFVTRYFDTNQSMVHREAMAVRMRTSVPTMLQSYNKIV